MFPSQKLCLKPAAGVLLLLFLSLPSQAQHSAVVAGTEAMPGTVDLPRTAGNPYFVSVSSVVNENGELDLSPFSEGARFLVERHLERDLAGGCLIYAPLLHEGNRPDRASLRVAAVESKTIVSGRVTGWIQGFQHGIPGTLVRIEIDEIPKGNPRESELLVFFPVGDFEFGTLKICNRHKRYSGLPALEDKLLLFLNQENPAGVVHAGGWDILIFPKGGNGLFQPRLADPDDSDLLQGGLSLESALTVVRKTQAGVERRP